MWNLYFLLVIGLQKTLVLCECNDRLSVETSTQTVIGRDEHLEYPQFEGDLFRAAIAVGNDRRYFLYVYSKVVKITSIRVDVRKDEGYSAACTISYSPDGIEFTNYRTADGDIKVFRYHHARGSSESTLSHHFRVPIIAQYVRVIPYRGNNDGVYTRMEFYGCDHEEIPYYFNGSSYIRRSLVKTPIRSTEDFIKFRFKTYEANGVFLYGRGLQNDHFGLMLQNNRLLLTINLGGGQATSLLAGSLLDDGVWHDVMMKREEMEISLSVDRVTTTGQVLGGYTRLDLDHVLYIGGVSNEQQGPIRMRNYTGCFEAPFFSWTNLGSVMQQENIQRECPSSNYFPFTFLSRESYVKFVGLDGIDSYEASFEFRTFEEAGMLLLHEFSNGGYLKVFLERGKLWTHLLTESNPLVKLECYEKYFSDGRWHRLSLSLRTNNMTMVVDDNTVVVVRLISIIAGADTFVGGQARGRDGFVGCIRKISINKLHKQAGYWQQNEEHCCKNELIFNSCRLMDRCNPNPCEHEGVCRQTSSDYSCDCSNTDYGGVTCRTALLPMNCHAYARRNSIDEQRNIEIDIDGSGSLPGFPVTCYNSTSAHVVTILHHENEATTVVDGFQDAGSYKQIITYRANTDQIDALIKQSTKCWQNLRYECFRSKLFNSPSLEGNFNPYSWWVSRYNQKMDFWGGATAGSRKCECGMLGQCQNRTKWCNCDADGFYEWRSDGGDIVGKEYLPVKQLRFGDTGSLFDDKQGKYTLGPLHCEGNDVLSNGITFAKDDVSIRLDALDVMGKAYDLYFEFKTAHPNGVIVEYVGHSGRLIVSLENGNAIRFMLDADSESSSIFGEHSSSLMDNNWHAVCIEVNRKEFHLVIDGNEHSRKRYFAELYNEEKSSSSLSIGGPLHKSASRGFVGCLRAFLINGQLIDLVSHVWRSLKGLYEGCVGTCHSNPCANNGSCVEYYDSYKCDCRWTSFKGPICADEVGAIFNGYSGVTYRFPTDRLSTISESIRIGFTTVRSQGILLKLYSSVSKEYFSVSISNAGYLRVIFDFGFERQEIIYPTKLFNLGYFHDLRISRSQSGSVLKILVDDYEPLVREFDVKMSADVQFDKVDHLFVGKEEDADEGFLGCISRVEFNDFYPLKVLFQQNPPNNIRKSGVIYEDFCGIEPVTHPPELVEERPAPLVPDVPSSNPNFASVMTFAGSMLFVMVVVFLIRKYVANQSAFYHTEEQIGAEDAADADNAVIHSKRGNIVLRKREWFI